jgi:altronate dehydratase large subunit
MEFLGYARPDGSVGIRNYILILPGGLIAEKVCTLVPGTKTVAMAKSGGGMTSRDRDAIARTLIGLACNPNVAGVILHSGLISGGYPELNFERLLAEMQKCGKPIEAVDVVTEGGTLETIVKCVKIARNMVRIASQLRREPAGIDKLCLGVKCGGSDPTSGMVGNPVVGYLFDKVVDSGGTAMFGEISEIIGAEHILAARAVDDHVKDEILRTVRFVEERALATGEDIRTMNPVPENIASGISSIEEKSLGAVYKAGHRTIQGVLKYAERPSKKGLFLVDSWMGVTTIFPGFVAAGAQLTLFQYGGGGGAKARLLLDMSPSIVAPMLWTSANPNTYKQCKDNLDFYSEKVIEGTATIEEAGEELLRFVVEIASGTLTRNETFNYADPIEVYGIDPLF